LPDDGDIASKTFWGASNSRKSFVDNRHGYIKYIALRFDCLGSEFINDGFDIENIKAGDFTEDRDDGVAYDDEKETSNGSAHLVFCFSELFRIAT